MSSVLRALRGTPDFYKTRRDTAGLSAREIQKINILAIFAYT